MLLIECLRLIQSRASAGTYQEAGDRVRYFTLPRKLPLRKKLGHQLAANFAHKILLKESSSTAISAYSDCNAHTYMQPFLPKNGTSWVWHMNASWRKVRRIRRDGSVEAGARRNKKCITS